MYRVELKVIQKTCKHKLFISFLMYRVELKVEVGLPSSISDIALVPNVPCGVESAVLFPTPSP